MDHFVIHLAPFRRRYPHPLPVMTIGYLPRKTQHVHHKFASFNASLILSGRGEYRFGDRIWEVRAPCVITQWPDERLEYGPDETWDELYMIFGADALVEAQRMNIADRRRPVWYVKEDRVLYDRLEDLLRLLKSGKLKGCADEVDRACDALILASLLGQSDPVHTTQGKPIRNAMEYLHKHWRERVDFDRLAENMSMSPATFRRHWRNAVGTPPGQYVDNLRMQYARRLLIETDAPINEIARRVGYEDPLYFSRRFKQKMHDSPRQYRRVNQSPGSVEKTK